MEAPPPCFFQPVVAKTAKINPSDMNFTLRFFNNSAKLAGDAIYGGQVNACYNTMIYNFGIYNLILQNIQRLSCFAGQMNSTHSMVASSPYSGCFYNTSLGGALVTLSCDNMHDLSEGCVSWSNH